MAITPEPLTNIQGPSAEGVITPSTTLSAATTGNGATVDLGAATRSTVSLIVLANGTVTGGVVDLQASHDGTNWVKISSTSPLGTGVNQHLSTAGAFRYVRAIVSSDVTGGGTTTATVMAF